MPRRHLLAQRGEWRDDTVEVELVQPQADRMPARAHLIRCRLRLRRRGRNGGS